MINFRLSPSLLISIILSVIVSTSCFAAKKSSNTPVSKEKAIQTATIVVSKLAKGEKIDKSWLGVKAKSAITRQYPQGTEWVIAFKNPKIKKKSNQILYIFLTITGKYVAANYTGQ